MAARSAVEREATLETRAGWAPGPTLTIQSTTIASNKAGSAGSGTTPGAAGSGGGLFTFGNPVPLQNTIVASNDGGNCSGSFTDLGHNIDFPGSVCPGADADPKLAALADNGGPTLTRAIGTDGAAFDQVPSTGAGCLGDRPARAGAPQGRRRATSAPSKPSRLPQRRPATVTTAAGPVAAVGPGAEAAVARAAGTPGGGGGTVKPTALSISLVLGTQKLRAVLSKGYVARFKTNQASTGVVELFVDGTNARGLKAAATKKVRVARGSAKATKAGTLKVTAKFTRKAKSVLGKRSKVTVTVQLTVTGSGGAKSVKSKRVTLKR